MQLINGRFALKEKSKYSTLKSINYEEHKFIDPKSTLNTRKSFWVDPKVVQQQKTEKILYGDKPKKNKLTFN